MAFTLFRLFISFFLMGIIIIIAFHIDTNPTHLISQIKSSQMYAPFAFILSYLLTTAVFLPSTPLTIISGILFGPYLGTIYVVLAALISGSVAFYIARFLGKDFVLSLLKNKLHKIEEYEKKFTQKGFLWIFVLRLIPIFPFNGLNLALGLTKVRFKDFFFATFLGTIPGTFAYAYLGDAVIDFSSNKMIIAIFLIAILGVVAYYFTKKQKEKL